MTGSRDAGVWPRWNGAAIAGLEAELPAVREALQSLTPGAPQALRNPICLGRAHRQLERILARSGQVGSAAKPILEINPRHDLILALASENDPVLRETLRTCCSTKRGFWMASFQLTPEPFRSAWHG